MKYKLLAVGTLIVICFTGCKTTSEKIKLKHSQINFYNGISHEDAILIAQNEMLGSRFYGAFDVLKVEVLTTEEAQNYSRFWFVRFQAKVEGSGLSHHVIVIDKRSGGVVKSSGWWPKDKNSLQWLFQ